MEEKKFCNTLHKSTAQDAPIPHSIKTDSLSWYLYRGKKAREILVEGERERASGSEGKRARSSSRTQKKGEKSTRTFSKLKFERGFVSDFRHVCTRARIDTSFFARATSK